MDEKKPGYKTTEFWLSTVATIVGIVMMSGALDTVPADSWISKVVGGIVAVLAALGYSAARAKTKAAETETPAE